MGIKIGLKPLNGRDTSDDSKNVGSARELTGNVFVLGIFVSPPMYRWTPAEVEDMKQRLLIAEKWLQKQAAEYGRLVMFQNGFYGSDGSLVDAHIPDSAEDSRAYFYGTELLSSIGFGSADNFLNWVANNTNCTQSLAIVFPHMHGRSFACPVDTSIAQFYHNAFILETCTIYQRFSLFTPISGPGVIAHEMLHLFGAWDLYELDERDKNRANTISKMYPNSIMRNSHGDINDYIIDEINAWLVGIRELKKEWYRWFEPNQDRYDIG